MTPHRQPRPLDRPCDDEELLQHWRGLLGPRPACRLEDDRLHDRVDLWLLLFAADGRQVPTVMPIEGAPWWPGPDGGARVAGLVRRLRDDLAPDGSAALALVRPGLAALGAADRAWCRALVEACREVGVPLRRPVVAGSRQVAMVTPDDLLPSASAA